MKPNVGVAPAESENTMTTDTINIEERLTAAEADLSEAEAAIGAAVLDGGDPGKLAARKATAQGAIEALRAAQAEREARLERESLAEIEQREQLAAWTLLSWWQAYVDRMVPVLRLRAELDAAEDAVVELGNIEHYILHRLVPPRRMAAWLDEQIADGRVPLREDGVVALPVMAVVGDGPQFHRPQRAASFAGLTVEQCKQLSKKIAPLLAAAAKDVDGSAPEQLPWETAA